jgi:hypothetical protein
MTHNINILFESPSLGFRSAVPAKLFEALGWIHNQPNADSLSVQIISSLTLDNIWWSLLATVTVFDGQSGVLDQFITVRRVARADSGGSYLTDTVLLGVLCNGSYSFTSNLPRAYLNVLGFLHPCRR